MGLRHGGATLRSPCAPRAGWKRSWVIWWTGHDVGLIRHPFYESAPKLVGSHDRGATPPCLFELGYQWNPLDQSSVLPGMKTRALPALGIAAALTGAGVGFMLLGPGGETPPQPQNTIEQALTRFVADRFGVEYVGRCPRQFPADGDIDWGVCSARASGSDGRVVHRVGHPFSEWVGEATLVRDASRSWRVASFEEYPPLGA